MSFKLFGSLLDDELLLLDSGLLTREVAEVEDAGPADLTDLVQFNAVDRGRLIREDSLDSDTAGNFADGKSPGERILTLDLDDDTSEFLKSLFVTFLDLIGNGDGVTGLELRIFSNFLVLERLLH